MRALTSDARNGEERGIEDREFFASMDPNQFKVLMSDPSIVTSFNDIISQSLSPDGADDNQGLSTTSLCHTSPMDINSMASPPLLPSASSPTPAPPIQSPVASHLIQADTSQLKKKQWPDFLKTWFPIFTGCTYGTVWGELIVKWAELEQGYGFISPVSGRLLLLFNIAADPEL